MSTAKGMARGGNGGQHGEDMAHTTQGRCVGAGLAAVCALATRRLSVRRTSTGNRAPLTDRGDRHGGSEAVSGFEALPAITAPRMPVGELGGSAWLASTTYPDTR